MGDQSLHPANRSGHIRGILVGTFFESRKALSDANVHPPLEHGIFRGPGGENEPAKSIVMANRPEYPNEDHGERFTYIGMGGHEEERSDDETGNKKKKTKRSTHGGPQTSDQTFDHPMNKALKVAAELGTLVRVIRGAGASQFAPYQGYRYDGLYYVENPRREMGPTGQFLVCKFDFVRSNVDQPPLPTDRGPEPEPRSPRRNARSLPAQDTGAQE